MLLKKVNNKRRKSASSRRLATVNKNRRLLFISHANPEDNAVASWFATQLSLLGYEVWCDLKNTHGGESDFWLKVQQTIEYDTSKFIFILSDTSRDFAKKPGVYKEVQAADSLRRENFIIPVRIEPLSGSVPIIIGPDLYISSENWAEGLRRLHERLVEDDVPRVCKPDYEKIASWWPALGVEDVVTRGTAQEMVSNLLPLKKLPENLHLLKVSAYGNSITGYKHLKSALPSHPAHYPYGDYAVSFARGDDYSDLTHDIAIQDYAIVRTEQFIEKGHKAIGIVPQIARNIVTFLVASALEKFLEGKGLQRKARFRSAQKTWYLIDGLIRRNAYRITEPGKHKVSVQLIGQVKYSSKRYMWHFGVQPVIDLYTLTGILLSPRVILSLPYNGKKGELPIPVDKKKVLKKLSWWNKQWRQKLLAFSTWLSEGQDTLRLQAGYQHILLSGQTKILTSSKSYLEKDDDTVLKEILGWTGE